MSTKLPAPIAQLLERHIDSFEKLELIVALHGAPRTTMSIEELCRALKLPRDVVREAAVELRGASLVALTSHAAVQLLPPSSQEHAAVTDLVRVYQDDRITVIKAMGEIALRRIRNMAARAFADAFVIRTKRKHDEDG